MVMVNNPFSYFLTNQYTPDKTGNLFNWRLLKDDINTITKTSYKKITDMGLTAYLEQPLMRAAVNVYTDNVIGTGLELQVSPEYEILGVSQEEAAKWGKEVEARFRLWAEKNDFFLKQNILYKNSKIRGDVLLFFQYEKKEIKIELAESTLLETDEQQNQKIQNGIIKNNKGIEIGIFLKNKKTISKYGKKSGRLNYLLFFIPDFPNQLRGLPLVCSVIEAAKNLDRFIDAETAAAVLNSSILGYWKRGGSISSGAVELRGKTKKSPLKELKPNTFLTVGASDELKVLESKRPTQSVEYMFNLVVQLIAAGTNLPAEMLTKKYTASYSASRAARIDTQENFNKEQKIFATLCNATIYKEWLKNEIIQKRIKPLVDISSPFIFECICKSKWNGTQMKGLNPLQEVKADIAALEEGLLTREQLARKYGTSVVTEHLQKWGEEKKLFEKQKNEEKKNDKNNKKND